ncbi:MAG: NAD(+)/NADH kinase [Dehalococcoidales bacterium]|nr:NAD(+)/NADH kinase [Dehalococcoidales bacterium]
MFKTIGILYHPMKEAAVKLAKDMEQFLTARKIAVWSCSAWEGDPARAKINGTDLILSIGGDGTILRAAQAVVPEKTPITGINLGNLGFMTELSVDEAKDKIGLLLTGEGWIDERSLLEAEVALSPDSPPRTFYALNDVVVARGAVARVINITASIDGEPLTTYKADGVIVATATGSTGYALAAGGPILHPHSNNAVLLPIMPHLSANYCLVLSPDAVVRLGVQTVHPATLSIDGHTNLPLNSGAVITVKRSKHIIRFLRIHPESSFYSSLEKRLKGK